MAARALAAAAGCRVGGQISVFPVLASCRRRGAQGYSHSSTQREEQNADRDDAAAETVTAEQVEAALNSKNVEEVVQDQEGRAAVVLPDEVVDGADTAWVPDQETGVFVPADEAASNGTDGQHDPQGTSSPSVMDQTVFVREEDMEDVERPAVDMEGDAQ